MRRIIAITVLALLFIVGVVYAAVNAQYTVLANSRTTTGRDHSAIGMGGNILVFASIVGTSASVDVECSTTGLIADLVVIGTLTSTGLVGTNLRCASIATNVTAISSATVESNVRVL